MRIAPAINAVETQNANTAFHNPLVSQGWAVAYYLYSYEYSRAEQRAKSARRGIWASEFETPWEWRRANR